MERRNDSRYETDTPATLHLLGEKPTVVAARIVEASCTGMRLESPMALENDRAVRLDVGDVMILGEVCYCQPSDRSEAFPFVIGIVTSESLTGLGSLQHLINALAREEIPVRQPIDPAR